MTSTGIPLRTPLRPDAATVIARLGDEASTIGDLAVALGHERQGLSVDGVCHVAGTRLVETDLVCGAEVTVVGAATRTIDPPMETSARWELRVVAGPDAGQVAALRGPRTIVGGTRMVSVGRGAQMASADIAIADPSLAPFHAQIDATGPVVVCVPLADRVAQACSLAATVPMRVGDSIVSVVERSTTATSAPPAAPVGGRRVHHRPPRRAAPGVESDGLELVDRPAGNGHVSIDDHGPDRSALVPTFIAAAVTGVIAVAMHQPMLALFGVSGVVVGVATWAHGRWRTGRQRVRQRREVEMSRVALERDVADRRLRRAVVRRLTVVDLCESLERIERLDPRLWERRPDHPDVWRAVLGIGEHTIGPDDVLRDVPVEVDLAPGAVVGLCGDDDTVRGIARSFLAQLTAGVGPCDLAVRIVTDMVDEWSWVGWLPHCCGVGEDTSAVAPAVHVVTIVHRREPGPVASCPTGAVVVLASSERHLPAECTAFGVTRGPVLRWHSDASSGLPTPVLAARLQRTRAVAAAARLAGLTDPLVPDAIGGGPVILADLLDLEPGAIVRAWEEAGADPPPRTPLVHSSHGTLDIDLVRDGPHALIGGTTGAGKSELLRSLVLGLAACSPPDALSFVLVDYKGGAAFDACSRLPHVVGMVTDLDASSAERALRSLHAELRRRERVLREADASDLTDLRRRPSGDRPPLARLVIVVDEFASLAAELPDFLHALVGVAQRGRSLGVHLVLATQRPGGVVTDDIRANTNLRIALRVTSVAEGVDIVGDALPATFTRSTPGRVAVRLGADELVVGQVASSALPSRRDVSRAARPVTVTAVESPFVACHTAVDVDGDPATGDHLAAIVAAVSDSAARRGSPPPHRPWRDPLPEHLDRRALLDPADHGLLDDPDDQAVRALRWDASTGHLVVVGAIGSGCTSTLATVARQMIADHGNDRLGLYVLDAHGDPTWDPFAASAHVGAVVRLAETERVLRLVHHIASQVEARRAAAGRQRGLLVVVIDGIGALRAALADLGLEAVGAFDRVVADGPAVGVVVAASSDQAASVPLALLSRATQRWVLTLADPLDAGLLGASSRSTPAAGSPPGRVCALPDRLLGQVLAPDAAAPFTGTGRRRRLAVPIGTLPTDIQRVDLPPPTCDGLRTVVTVGVGARSLDPVTMEFEPGSHVLVVGPARSGRTTTLLALAESWASIGDDRRVVVLAPRWSTGEPAAARAHELGWTVVPDVAGVECTAAGEHVLFVVDDGERIEDPQGALATLVASDGVTALVGGRADGLRAAFGHWTHAVRRSRTGIVLGAASGTDGDVLSTVLPRHRIAPVAPGRGWLVVDGECIDLVQIGR